MTAALWFVLVGLLLLGVALAITSIRRLPLTTALIYLCIGWILGPEVIGLISLDGVEDAALIERLSEIAVIVSLFTAGLKLRLPLRDRRWRSAMRLAFGSMSLTVGLVTLAGVYLLNLPLGAAVLLGAVLAPTDPVLASDVQVGHPYDKDPLRFSLTGEAGLNDGTAFPFVMLGLGLLGLHDLGDGGWRWWSVDVVWAIAGGLGIGTALGTLVGHLVLYLRRRHREAIGSDDFIAIGLIALSYGVALLCYAYGFLAVFAAGLALRRIERRHTESVAAERPEAPAVTPPAESESSASHPEHAPAYMTDAVRYATEHLERLGELVVVLIVGAMLGPTTVSWPAVLCAALLMIVIRPIGVVVGLLGQRWTGFERLLLSWFGIRGIGSVYYLMYAVEHGVPEPIARQLIAVVLTTVAVSTLVHGVTVTGLMKRRATIGHSL